MVESKHMRIAHLSDIHVQTQRREEFAAVFSSLKDQLLSESPPINIIAITGDVYDKRTPTPLNSSDVEALLKMLATIAPVVMIPGNHDLNMKNRDTADALGELMKVRWGASPPSGITYISTSGIHKAHGVTWFTVMPDDKNGLPDPETIPTIDDNSPLVTLIHETVVGCKYANGTSAESGGVTRDYLSAIAAKCRNRPNSSCAILLGDIHLRQQIRFEGDGEKACAWYAGSTVCLNLGEHHLNHGYLVWDVPSSEESGAITVAGRDVYNSYAPLTINIDDKGNDITLAPVPIAPSKWRILYNRLCPRVILNAREAEMISRFSKEAYVGSAPVGRTGDVSISEAVAELTESTVRERHMLVARKLVSAGKWTEPVIEAALEEYNVKVVEKLALTDLAGSKPHLIELRFDNIFCYGEGNVINFEALSQTGITHGLIAPNRWGKSCIFDIITYAVTGDTKRFKLDDLPRRSSSSRVTAKVQLTFKVGNDTYIVKRTRGSPSTCSWFENGIDMTTGHTNITSKCIQKILGDHECLNRLCFMRPQEVTGVPSFHMMDQKKRAVFVSNAMKLAPSSEDMESMRKEVDVKALSAVVKNLRDKLRSLVSEAWKGKYLEPPTLEKIILDEASCLEELNAAEKTLEEATILTNNARSRYQEVQEKSYSEEGRRSSLAKTLKDLQGARDSAMNEIASLPIVANIETLTAEYHEATRREELNAELKTLIDRRNALKANLRDADNVLEVYQQLQEKLVLVSCHENESSSREVIITEEKTKRDGMHRNHQQMIIHLLNRTRCEMAYDDGRRSLIDTEMKDREQMKDLEVKTRPTTAMISDDDDEEEALLSTMWESRLTQRHSLHDSGLFQRVTVDIRKDRVDIKEETLPIIS